ncbi:MAG: hypothetical protein RR320_04830, partial [Oscillospiraceae bacterium]
FLLALSYHKPVKNANIRLYFPKKICAARRCGFAQKPSRKSLDKIWFSTCQAEEKPLSLGRTEIGGKIPPKPKEESR